MCKKLICLISFVLVLGLTLTSPADAELVAWWKFDEGTGTTASDSGPSGNHGTIEGGAQWVGGQLGGALRFNGSNARVVASNIPLNSRSFTIAMWVNPVLYTTQQSVFSTGLTGSTNTDMHLRLGGPGGTIPPPGNVRMGFYANDLDTTNAPIEDNNWYHLTFWYNFENATRRIYVDGVQQAQDNPSSAYLGTSGSTIIGAWGGGEWFQGIIDDVQIYDHALTETEIQTAMHGLGGNPYATNPNPEDKKLLKEFIGGILGTTLSWKKGDFAKSHNVYFGDDFDAVNDGTGATFVGNQSATYLLVGYGYTPNDPLPGGLVPGTTYYWRIDEVNDTDPNSPWKGKIWSFSLPPTKAYFPNPSDESKFIDPNVDLSWGPGFGGIMQTVYFGEDYDAVNDGTIEGVQVGISAHDPGPLEYEKTYYWRVETTGTYGLIKGDVWSFKTAKKGGGIRADYYNGQNFETYRLTRIDPRINFNWGDPGSPDPLINTDQFSARWTGQVEAGFTETYTFYANTDDGVRLWVDGQLIIDDWFDRAPAESSATIDLVEGQVYDIQMEYYENGGGAVAQLRWSSGHTPKDFIPEAALSPPFKASNPNPPNGATGTKMTPTLTWSEGDSAVSHEVYFGTDYDAVRNATKASPEYIGPRVLGSESYEPGRLTWFTTYYWRIDEVNNLHPDSPWKGSIWTFTTGDFLVVDDFEDYNVTDRQIWAIWHDGIGYWDLGGTFHPGNGTGAGVGDEDNDATYMEETIINSGAMSMPYFYNNNEQAKAKYSEAKMTLVNTRNWTEEGVKALSLWFRGYPESAGSFTDNLDGTYTVTVSGADITGPSDEFHYAYKSLNGLGSIIARVDSMDNTDGWAKAGVMIRDSLDPNSAHAMIFVTPSNGVVFEYRPDLGADNVGSAAVQSGITAPQWVMLERIAGGIYRASYSSDGSTWEILGELVSGEVSIGTNALIGLSLSGNNPSATCQAIFSNVQMSVSGPWANQDIGIQSNDPERMYVAIANSNGTTGTVYYEDNDNIVTDATQIGTWTEFNIDLKDFQAQGVNLADVNSIAIGIGTRGGTTPGGAGKMYFDDIRLYRPRYIPGKGTPLEADINADGIVDYRDLKIMTNNWLNAAETLNPANLIAQYNFENNLLDSIGSNNGTAMGSPTYSAGIDGQAIDLDGVDDYVETNKTPSDLGIGGGAAKTVIAWAYTRSFNDGGIFDMGDNVNGENFSLRTLATTNTWRVQRYGYPTYDFDFMYPSLNEWVHFALVYEGNDAGNESRAYADGVLVGTQTIELDTADTRTFAIGVWSGNYFDGLIDDLRLYGRALSTGEIISLAGGSALDLNDDMNVNFKDYAVLAGQWLDEQLWPEE